MDASQFYRSMGPEFVQEEDEENSKLYFPFEKATWDRYMIFCRKTRPLWGCSSHNEKITMIIEMAEKYYAWLTDPKAKSRSTSIKATKMASQTSEGNRYRDEFIRLSKNVPSGLISPPTTPVKTVRGSSGSTSVGSGRNSFLSPAKDSAWTVTQEQVQTSRPPDPMGVYKTSSQSGMTDPTLKWGLGWLSSQPDPIHVVDMKIDGILWGNCSKFFNRHGWSKKTDSEKVAILLEIAKQRAELATFCDVEDRRARIEWGISKWKLPADSGASANIVGTSDIVTLSISMVHSLWEWYNNLLESMTSSPDTHGERLGILLGLAETYLDLGLTYKNFGSSFLEDWHTPSTWDWRKGSRKSHSEPETVPFLFWLSPHVRKRYKKLLIKHDWSTETDETNMITLLDLAESHPAMRAKEEAEKMRKSLLDHPETTEMNEIDDEEESIASDGTWDDETETITDLPDTSIPSESNDQEVKWLRLLKPDYYLKFSEGARNTIPAGSKRSLAAMINTRKHIVERYQLKQLVAQCHCSDPKCDKKIKKKSIKINELAWVIQVTGHCENRRGKHKFEWISSTKLPHNKTIYALNVAVPASAQLSGNNLGNIEHFAKVLRMSWGSNHQSLQALHVCKQVIRKCFEMTQTEMLDTLKSETGQIVLAGDGQFDSPGSCATLCTYTLMALGVDEDQNDGTKSLKRCEYIISQSVIDRRHADNKSVNMERVGLHWALQPIIQAGIKVAEMVTDDHVQISSDFRKISNAAQERDSNTANGKNEDTALTVFRDSLSSALLHHQPPVDVQSESMSLLSFYSDMIHSNDIWHKAKNLLKTVSTIAQSAPAKEQQTYKRYAKMLRNYLWDCAKGAQGSQEKFLGLWKTVHHHLHDDHSNCAAIELHSKTKLMSKLDQTTRSFGLLIRCLRKIETSAAQLCRFRKTGVLEGFNGLTLKYCPKRIRLPYDTMVMRRDLAALDHNHHVMRDFRRTKGGQLQVAGHWKKSTKAFFFSFQKEEKDYKYLGHLMAAILAGRYESNIPERKKVTMSAAHPKRIHQNLASAAAGSNQNETMQQARSEWLAKQKIPSRKRPIKRPVSTKNKPKAKYRRRGSSESSIACTSSSPASPLTISSDSEESDWSGRKVVKRKKAPRDHEWKPEKSDDHKKRRTAPKSDRRVGKRGRPKKVIKNAKKAQINETGDPAMEEETGRQTEDQEDPAKEVDHLEASDGQNPDQELQTPREDEEELVEGSQIPCQESPEENLAQQEPESSESIAQAVKQRTRTAGLNCLEKLESEKRGIKRKRKKFKTREDIQNEDRQELESSESDGLHVLGLESDSDGSNWDL